MADTVDYTKFSKDGAVAKNEPIQKRWWLADKKDLPQAVTRIVNWLGENDSKRQTQYQMSARLYGNVTLMGINGLSYSKLTASQTGIKDRVTYNVVQSAIDTLTSKIAKNKPKPLFLTSGGDYKIQRKAKKLDKFCQGVYYENNSHMMMVQAFRDSTIFGDGLIHPYRSHDRVAWERVLASELYVDMIDAFYGHPRQLHRIKNVDREVLAESFPSKKGAIKNAPAAKVDLTGLYQNVSDQVTVVESWHLPSGPEAKDGIHTICLEQDDLLIEDYNRPYFPFAKLSWCPRLYGYWSQGIPEQIQSTQLEINKIAWVIQRSMHLAGTFKVWFKNGTKVVKEHINNEIGAIINSEEMPQYLVPPIVQPETYQRLAQLKADAFEQVGISMLSAASQKPQGLDSGKALREFNDIESDRFMTVGQAYEEFALQLARLSIDVAKEIYSDKKKFEVRVPGKKFIETIDWKDIDLEEDEYVMKIFPVSSLPNEPAGRLETVQEYVQAGFMAPRSARRLLDFPDLEQVEDLANAQEEWIHEVLEKIVEKAEYTPPDPAMDLNLAKELFLQYYAYAQTQGLEEDKTELLRKWSSQVNLLVQKSLPPPMPMPIEPQAVPEQPPVSDLVQNIPQVGVQ